jgi:hypothetical protein
MKMRHHTPRRIPPVARSKSIDEQPARDWMVAATVFVIAALTVALSGI